MLDWSGFRVVLDRAFKLLRKVYLIPPLQTGLISFGLVARLSVKKK